MKFTQLFFVVAVLAVSISACNTYGKKYEIDKKHAIYSGDGVNEGDAKKLGDYLTQIGLFQPSNEASVQISKPKESKDTINLRFVVKKDKVTPEIDTFFTELCSLTSEHVFNNAPVNIFYTDDSFDSYKKITYIKMATPDQATSQGPASGSTESTTPVAPQTQSTDTTGQ